MAVTRRQFLQQVGITGGAGVMFSTMGAMGMMPAAEAKTLPFRAPKKSDFTLTGKAHKNILILGGGIAGLTSAYHLQKAGYDVTILEANNRPGGRNWTVRKGDTITDLRGETQEATFTRDQYMNAGPARLPQNMVTLDYCRELGVPIEPFINQNADAYQYREGTTPISNRPIRHREAKADVYGYVSELLAKATDQGSLDTYLTQTDKDALIAFLRNFGALGNRVAGDPAGSFKYTGTDRRGFITTPGAGFEDGEPVPPFAMQDVLAAGLGNYFSFEFGWDQAMMMFQPVGGMDRIAYAFEEAVGKENIRYEAEVTNIENTSTGVKVQYMSRGRHMREISADYAICTMPPQIVAKTPSNLPADIIAANAYATKSRSGKLGIEYNRRWWEEDERIYGGITNTNMDISNMWYPSSGFHGERGVVIGYYSSSANYGNLNHAGRVERALMQGAKIHGEKYKQDIKSTFSISWDLVKYQEAAWNSWPSRTNGHYGRLLEPAGNIYFAGDHLSHTIAWQHGAIESARLAITKLHERVLSR
ncbi:flavin monoamine oxidase family protein [Motilibacter deserti]|uniref:FAD-dependent oxidoreductase n=1 Tax=Motilibacter deserti TaxID=2714956 RepID=A0ABX0GYV0_9ACTN|nr:FAD-dependent oxidoreductase [Motilibacter deserti]NHC14880.1 FAD-dependent oxidoreductase [Motilibacter deserti]